MPDQNNAPERIWLQEAIGPEHDRTWCAEQQDDDDTLYIRADLARADRAAPEGQVRGYTEIADIIDRNITDETVNGRHRLLLEGEWHEGPVVDWVHKTMTGIRDLLRKYAALTPPPAAPTDSTALVEDHICELNRAMSGECMTCGSIDQAMAQEQRQADLRHAALASREASPACQQEALVEALEIVKEHSDDGAMRSLATRTLNKYHAAPTDNTALVEALRNMMTFAKSKMDDPTRADDMRIFKDAHAAIANREAPPAAQEPVAWRCKDYADDWIIYRNKADADQYQAVTGCLMQPLYAAPPPACQQEAVTERALLQRAVDLIKGDLMGSEWKRACNAFVKDALRALKGKLE
ncbi:hypothetical protein E2976_17450 [Paracoccus yeei]|uniref:hypothetical protein n=1 Tax=Paracoccus yeei TaxID=147645 RepID=UPI003BF7EE85